MSYNSLLTDPDLVARWNGDADGDGTGDAINAATPGTYDGTWTGTAAYAAGEFANGNAFDFTGANHIEVPLATDPTAFTLCGHVRADVSQISAAFFRGIASEGNEFSHGFYINGSGNWAVNIFDGAVKDADTGIAASTVAWQHLAFTAANGGTGSCYVDAVSEATIASIGTLWTGGDRWKIGAGGTNVSRNANAFDGRVHDVWLLHRVLTAPEVAEVRGGPEPTYTSGATLAANGAYDVGAWTDPSNGTRTYEWVVVEADGTVVDSGTGATGTATFGATTGLLTLLVRASNDGGYDVGDFATRTSGYGSSGDGYYEVATVDIPNSVAATITMTLPTITSAATATPVVACAVDMTIPSMTTSASSGVPISNVRLKTIVRPIVVKSITRPITVFEVPV